MTIKLIKQGSQGEKKKDQPAGPEQLRLTAQSWVNEFKARKRNGSVVSPAEQDRLQNLPLDRAA